MIKQLYTDLENDCPASSNIHSFHSRRPEELASLLDNVEDSDDFPETFVAQSPIKVPVPKPKRNHSNNNESKHSKHKPGNSRDNMNGPGLSRDEVMASTSSISSHSQRFPSLGSDGPDVEAGGGKVGYHQGIVLDIEREENVKCIVTSSLFFAIIILIFIVMFTLNPEM